MLSAMTARATLPPRMTGRPPVASRPAILARKALIGPDWSDKVQYYLVRSVGKGAARAALLVVAGQIQLRSGVNRLRTSSVFSVIVTISLGLIVSSQVETAGVPPGQSVWDGVYTDQQAQRGRALYETECGSCHGAELEGDAMAPPLAGASFPTNWDGLPLSELADRIRMTMPVDMPGKLNREQTADIIAYMLERNGFPAGAAELPGQADAVQGIAFEARKP